MTTFGNLMIGDYDDKCFICSQPYKHRCRERINECGLIEVQFDVMHKRCFNLKRQADKAKQRMLDLEWKIFQKIEQKKEDIQESI